MDQQQSFRSTLVEWLKEIVPYNRLDDYARLTREVYTPFSTDLKDNSVTYIFCTNTHTYQITARADYLGAQASARKVRPGENWTRDIDLPDGKFCRETWEKIKNSIIHCEAVKLDKHTHMPVPDLPIAEIDELAAPLTDEEIATLEYAAVHHNLGHRRGTGKNKYLAVSLVQKLLQEYKQYRNATPSSVHPKVDISFSPHKGDAESDLGTILSNGCGGQVIRTGTGEVCFYSEAFNGMSPLELRAAAVEIEKHEQPVPSCGNLLCYFETTIAGNVTTTREVHHSSCSEYDK